MVSPNWAFQNIPEQTQSTHSFSFIPSLSALLCGSFHKHMHQQDDKRGTGEGTVCGGQSGLQPTKKGENSHRWSPQINNNVKHIPGNLSLVTASGPSSVITHFDDLAEMENTWQNSMLGVNLLSHDFLPVMKPDICRGSCPSVATAISSWPRDSQKSSRLFRSISTSAKSGSCTH